MSKTVRVVQSTLAGAALASISLAHIDDPKGRVPHITYMGPGWTAAQGWIGAEGALAGATPNFPSSNVELVAWLPCPQFDFGGATNTSANTVESYVSPGGREYAIIGLSDGTGFVDVTVPESPVIRSFIPSVDSLWHDVRVFGQYCYNVSEGGGGIQVINIANLDTTGATLVGNVTADGPIPTNATHTVFINPDSGFLYRAGGGSNGLRIYNLNNTPATPQYVTAWTDRYVHEVTVVTYTSGPYAGKEIAFACGGLNGGHASTGVYILDVTNVTDNNPNTNGIVQLAYYTYPNARYCHQGWLSPDKQFFYINDELDDNQFQYFSQTRIVNVSNLSAPTNAGVFTTGVNSIDHNLYTKDNLVFESNYRAGLRIFDATNPTAPVQIGYFDTWPDDSSASFNGLWDNDPYLPSGLILGSDIEKGLFVWRRFQIDIAFPNGSPTLFDPNGEVVPVTITSVMGTFDPASPTLHYSVNGGAFIETPLVALGGNAYEAVFPDLPCNGQVRWYVTAQTMTGGVATGPADSPLSAFSASVASSIVEGAADTLEAASSWTIGLAGDNATSGIWLRANPVGTAAQPEDDHTPAPGVNCFITGNGTAGGGVGEADIDGGTTTLTSPAFDASTAAGTPFIVYYRWYSNNAGSAPNEDTMPIQISSDGGTNWVQLELVNENAGTWVRKAFRISDFVPVTNQIRLRFIARDLGAGSVVEAGVDDVSIEYVQCFGPGDVNGDGIVNVTDLLSVIGAWGPCPATGPCNADLNDDGVVNVTDLLAVIANWG